MYFDGGIQIISPTDLEIETAMAAAPFADQIARTPVEPADADLVERYIERAAGVRRCAGSVRVALTPLHGVGGAVAVETLRRAGFASVHSVGAQFAPDPDFPTVAFPNPEEPGATDALLTLAADVGADVAIALDPDADRCAVGIPSTTGWRMLSGDETGWLLGDYILSQNVAGNPVVASTVVSSRMLAAIAARYGATHVETLTGFKWLARADEDVPGTLVYAYEEAIGHCVDPAAVRDKDGISAAVLVCDLVAALKEQGRSVPDALDELARRHGVHEVAAVSRRVADAQEAAELMRRLREAPPERLAGFTVDHHRHHRRADLHRRRRRHLGQGGGAAVGYRAKAQVLHGGSPSGDRRAGTRPGTGPSAARRAGVRRTALVVSEVRTGGRPRRRDPARCRRSR